MRIFGGGNAYEERPYKFKLMDLNTRRYYFILQYKTV